MSTNATTRPRGRHRLAAVPAPSQPSDWHIADTDRGHELAAALLARTESELAVTRTLYPDSPVVEWLEQSAASLRAAIRGDVTAVLDSVTDERGGTDSPVPVRHVTADYRVGSLREAAVLHAQGRLHPVTEPIVLPPTPPFGVAVQDPADPCGVAHILSRLDGPEATPGVSR